MVRCRSSCWWLASSGPDSSDRGELFAEKSDTLLVEEAELLELEAYESVEGEEGELELTPLESWLAERARRPSEWAPVAAEACCGPVEAAATLWAQAPNFRFEPSAFWSRACQLGPPSAPR